MNNPLSTPELLQALLARPLTGREVDALIDATIGNARRYVQWLVWKRGYTLGPLGMSVDDLSYDLVAELVSELDGEILGRLRTALRDLTEPPDQGYDIESAFIAIVNRTVRFHIARLFTEIQPLHARLLRSLRRYAERTEGVERIDTISGYWYAAAGGIATLHLPPVPMEVLRTRLRAIEINGSPVASILDACLEAVEGMPGVRRAVSEHDVLELTTELIQLQHREISSTSVEAVDPSERDGAGAVLRAALDEARQQLQKRYVDRGKLSQADAEAMIKAMTLYLDDLEQDDALGHFSYLRQLMPGLTQQRYRSSYRNIYEYVLRGIFTNARQRLEYK